MRRRHQLIGWVALWLALSTACSGGALTPADTAPPLPDASLDAIATDGPSAADGAPPRPVTLYSEQFEAILDTLLTRFWDASGDWQGDMQGDATTFAPRLLYALAAARGQPDLRDKALTTVAYAASLLGGLELSMEALGGFPALVDGYMQTGDAAWEAYLRIGASAGYELISETPEQLTPYLFDEATALGTGAYMCLLVYEALDDADYLDKGLDLITQADRDYWNESEGLYRWSQLIDWPQATMIMALAKAYQLTDDESYRQRSDRLVASMDTCCWDTLEGGYFGHWGQHKKGLSANNSMAWGLLDLYEVTGDSSYLDKAQQILDWIMSTDLYHPQQHLLYHHWEDAEGEHPGRADYFCTGCNFHTLVNIYRFNQLAPGTQ